MLRIAPAVTLALLTAAPAYAEPVVPQPGSSCSVDLTDVTTMLAGQSTPLVCRDGRWQPVPAPAAPSDRWVSFGPTMALHGEGLRNPNLRSGSWTATPLAPDARCAASQQAVLSAGVVGAPMTAEGAAGQPLSLEVAPRLFDIAMTGHCLWVREP
ncbi:hypothetical protein ACWDUN_10055 [Mycobacterium sp. NPDC003323]